MRWMGTHVNILENSRKIIVSLLYFTGQCKRLYNYRSKLYSVKDKEKKGNWRNAVFLSLVSQKIQVCHVNVPMYFMKPHLKT